MNLNSIYIVPFFQFIAIINIYHIFLNIPTIYGEFIKLKIKEKINTKCIKEGIFCILGSITIFYLASQ